MIEKKTVLVLGAGASKPYGYPLGSELRDSVIGRAPNISYYESALNLGFSSEQYAEFSQALAHSGFSSVDAFLEVNDEWLEIGKSAIALDLLGTEKLVLPKLFPPGQPRDHWYEALWQRIKTSSLELFEKNPVSIITFNYDRSLEHYLVTVLCSTYRVSANDAVNSLRSLPVLHVHGHLGEYIDKRNNVDVGLSLSQNRFDCAKKNIRIVHEDKGDSKEFLTARKLINGADRILFLGFGYHAQNVIKLGLHEVNESNGRGAWRVWGTHKGIKRAAWERICITYGFCYQAINHGSGSISDFINELLY